MDTRRRRPSASMIVAIIALVAAISGTSYAAMTVTSADIADETIRSVDVKDEGLFGRDIANDSIGGVDIKADTVRGSDVLESSLGKVPSAADADTLSGQTAADQKVRWLLLNEQGEIEDQSGGFTVIDAYDTNSNAYIDAGESLVGKGFSASIAIQNQVNTNGMEGADPNFAGEVSVTRCQITGVVACAPTGAQNVNALVVSPRNSDGSAAAGAASSAGAGSSTKRVYVVVTE